MKMETWTVARFPDGSWSTGGQPDSPEYAACEVWQVEARSREHAEREAKRLRRNALLRAARTKKREG